MARADGDAFIGEWSVIKSLIRRAQQVGLARAVCIVLLFALVPLRLADPRPLEELRVRTFDFFQVLRPRPQELRPVVIVDIDEESLKAIGQWPWPRTTVADLITQITRLGAVAIGFDIIFPEPDRMSPAIAERSFRGIDAETRAKLDTLPSNDEALADAIRHSRVVVGQAGAAAPEPVTPADAALQTGFAVRGPDPSPYLVTFRGLLRNVPPIEQAAAGRGLFSIDPESDGIIRRVPIIMKAQGSLVPSLSLEMLRVVTGSSAILVRVDQAGVQAVAVPGLEIPTDRNGQFWVHFNRHDPTRYVSAKDVLQGNVPPDRLAGKLVLIGTSAIGLLDLKTTPTDAAIPGVEVHAQILESVLSKSNLVNPNYAIGAELALAVLFGLAIIIAAPMLPASIVIVLGGCLIAGLIGLSLYLFVEHNLLIDFTYPLISSWLIYLVLTFVNYLREQKQRRQIRSAFGYYLSPHMVEQLARSPEKLVLGGEERRMTILFSDVRGFTTISEYYKDDPQGLTRLMNRFLTPLTNAIIDRKGTIDKYIGDAIMAFWNAPVDDAEQEANACEAALEMLSRAETLNDELKHEAEVNGGVYMPLRIGIGLNTGPCVVGNMGSDFRFNYSVLGDTVNLASRLEARTKDYRIPVVIGSRTAEGAKQKFAVMEIDLIMVKGKKQPEAVFTVLGPSQVEADPRCGELREINAQMLGRFRSQQWDNALELVARCRKFANGFDLSGLYDMYEERIALYRTHPPGADWDGVYEAETK
ncbi:MAG TPA: adenylate/guanylate cyclase domain-containing protein [Xanthobacteraceae bacterium]|jgi:adenylate cyclase|nr:adenylate/guanylate cyclase domain-containing protein [Xanthobacteraceae bacterium]